MGDAAPFTNAGLPGANLDLVVEELAKIKDQLDAINERKRQLTATEENLEKLLIEQMNAQNLKSIKTGLGSASIKPETFPQLEDWSLLAKYVVKTGRVDLFQRRLSKEAVQDIKTSSGALPPGVKEYDRFKLTFRRSK